MAQVQTAKATQPSDAAAILSAAAAQPSGAPAFNAAVTEGLTAALAASPELLPPGSAERVAVQAAVGGLLSDVGPDERAYGAALPLLNAVLEAARAAAAAEGVLEEAHLPTLRALSALGTLQVRREEHTAAEPMLLKVRGGPIQSSGWLTCERVRHGAIGVIPGAKSPAFMCPHSSALSSLRLRVGPKAQARMQRESGEPYGLFKKRMH